MAGKMMKTMILLSTSTCLFILITTYTFKYRSGSSYPVYSVEPDDGVKTGQANPASRYIGQLHMNTSSAYVGQCQHKQVVITAEECEIYTTHELEDRRIYPANHVSGAPGSGNDWVLWLASPTRYSWSLNNRELDCSIYIRQKHNNQSYKTTTTECLFIKSHEPWGDRNWSLYAKRVALLLRHPYDAEFAEYKRQLTAKTANVGGEQLKSDSSLLKISKFIHLKTNRTTRDWRAHIAPSVRLWLAHAKYWLVKSSVPVHVLLYNSLKTNTEQEVEELQAFFGYTFDGANFRRHCCVVKNSYNGKLKRAPSAVDKYKNYAYEQDENIRNMVNSAVNQVHQMLDKKFPDKKYRITRG